MFKMRRFNTRRGEILPELQEPGFGISFASETRAA